MNHQPTDPPSAAAPQLLLRFVVFKLDVETIFNPNLHLNGGVEFGVSAQGVDHDVELFADVVQPSDHCGAEEIPANRAETPVSSGVPSRPLNRNVSPRQAG